MLIKQGDKILQCVIGSENKANFEKLGFVDSEEKLAQKPAPKNRTKKA